MSIPSRERQGMETSMKSQPSMRRRSITLAFMILCSSLLLVACAPAPTSVPTVIATVIPTDTVTLWPTATPLPTYTLTPTPTSTPTRTPTLTPTPRLVPQINAITSLYAGPSNYGYETIAQLSKGTKVTPLTVWSDFVQVEVSETGKKGFVLAKSIDNLPDFLPQLAKDQVPKQTLITADTIDRLVELRTIALPKPAVSLAISPDSKFLAVGGCEQCVGRGNGGWARVYAITTGQEVFTPQVSTSSISSFAFSPDGRVLAVGFTNEVRLFDVVSGEYLGHFEIAGPSWRAIYSPDGKLMAFWGPGWRSVTLWDPSSKTILRHIQLEGWGWDTILGASDVSFSPDGKFLVWGDRSYINFWNLRDEALSRRIAVGVHSYRFTFSADSTLLAVGACAKNHPQGSRCIWKAGSFYITLVDVKSGTEIRRLQENADLVDELAFSPDGTLLVSTSFASKTWNLIFWDVKSYKEIRRFENDKIFRFAISPDGKFLITNIWGELAVRIYGLK